MTKKIAAIVTAAFIISCGPGSKEIPTDVEMWKNEDFASALSKLDDEDKKSFARWMVRTAMLKEFQGKEVPTGMTISEAIEEQRVIDSAAAQEEAVKEEARKANELARAGAENEMREAASVLVTKFSFDIGEQAEYDFDDAFVISMDITNNTTKTITAMKGEIAITDIFDQHIKTYNMVIDNTIPVSETITWSGVIDFNKFDGGDSALLSSDPQKLKFLWKPGAVAFDDGTKMEAP